jgi:carbon-monoxide dehydrogenase large subunit
MDQPAPTRYVGQPRKRVEDAPLLIGVGRYVDDVPLPGILHVALVRSPHAHAGVGTVDADAARRAPGVVAVVTGADVTRLGQMPTNRMVPGMKVPPHPVLAADVVRAPGTPVAAVVADTAAQAQDAAELVTVDWEPRPSVVTPEAALAAGAPRLAPDIEGNVSYTHRWRAGDAAAAFRDAACRVAVEIVQPRLSAVAMEPRAVLAWLDPSTDELRIWASSQAPFRVRADVAAATGVPESRVRVVAPQVGGGFGVKGSTYLEDVLVAWLALTLRRPVKWVATRREDLLTTQQGRGVSVRAELALAADGKILGLRGQVKAGAGGRFSNSAAVTAWNAGRCMPGAYVVPAADIESTATVTTTPPQGAYRGAGRPEGTFTMERLMDKAARALGLDPAELRRRNLVPREAFPFRSITGQSYDSGDYRGALERCLDRAGWERMRAERHAARDQGALSGVGVVSYVEPSSMGWESGSVRVERTGAVTLVTGSSAHGQGHETTWAQIVADALGVRPEDVTVRHGDTGGAPQGFGTFGSRSTTLGGSAALSAARQVRDQGRNVAAGLLEAAAADVVPVDGGFHVAGAPTRRVTWTQVAAAAYAPTRPGSGVGPGLEATVFFQAPGEVWSYGTCVAAVRVDRDTGHVALTRCVWVDDAGTIVNPLLAEGQLHGSYAQGAGQALMEAIVFDEDGQLVSGTLMDYAVPRADDLPEPELDETHTPSPLNPLGAKGLGEAGCIAVPPVIVNAVLDALAPLGVTDLDMPLTAARVWEAMRRARA